MTPGETEELAIAWEGIITPISCWCHWEELEEKRRQILRSESPVADREEKEREMTCFT